MSFTLESFASDVQRILKADPNPAGREKVRHLVQEALKDEKFISTYINDNTAERQVIYEDPELGFCVCAHVNRDAREANPHDHGNSWAIYGQALGETEMSDWEVPEPAAGGKPGKIKRGRVYTLKPVRVASPLVSGLPGRPPDKDGVERGSVAHGTEAGAWLDPASLPLRSPTEDEALQEVRRPK